MSKFYIIFAMLCCWGCARPREQVFKNSLLAREESREKLVERDVARHANEWFLGDSTNIARVPDEWLLGAPSLVERDEICEAVVRWIATTQTNACYFYFGFEDTTHISDITDLNFVSQPIGQDGGQLMVAETSQPWTKERRSVVVGYEVSRKGVRCTILGIKLISKDEAEVHARWAALSLLWRFHLRHENSAWKVLDGEPTTAL